VGLSSVGPICWGFGTVFKNVKSSTTFSFPRIKFLSMQFIYLSVTSTLNSSLKEKKEPTDDTSKDVYSLLAQHVSGIIMPIVRRTD